MVVKPAPTTAAEARKQGQKADQDTIKLGPGALAGNLTADPELRYTPSGRPVARMRVAVSDRRQDPDTQKWVDGPTEFYSISAWGQLAEHCAEHLARGHRIVAEGEWTERKWTDHETGEIKSAIEFTARDLGPSMIFHGARVIKAQRQQ